MKNLKIVQLGVFLLTFTVLFTACDLTNAEIDINTNNNNNSNENVFSLIEDDTELDCVEFVYPMTVSYPDGSTAVLTNKAALINLFSNASYTAIPTLNFPIQVIGDNGSPETVATEDDLIEIFEDCLDYDDCDCEYEEECFTVNYPITLILPDGTQVTVNDDNQMETAIDNYYDTNPNDTGDVGVVYPVSVTMLEDGSVITINNDNELDAVFESCYDDFYQECFEVQFPISIQMPDNSVITANSEMELDSLYEAWEAANPNAIGHPNLVFPITVLYEDGTTETANDEDELMELYEDCFEFLDDCDGMIRSSDIIIGASSDAVERVVIQKSKSKVK